MQHFGYAKAEGYGGIVRFLNLSAISNNYGKEGG